MTTRLRWDGIQNVQRHSQRADRSAPGHGEFGSSANLLAIAALANPEADALRPGVGIVPAILVDNGLAEIQLGLVPVVVDIDPATLNMTQTKSKLRSRKNARRRDGPCLRNPCDLEAILDICDRHSLILVEDCCEALGAKYEIKRLEVSAHGNIQLLFFASYYDARRRHHRRSNTRRCRTHAYSAGTRMDSKVEDQKPWIERCKDYPRFSSPISTPICPRN